MHVTSLSSLSPLTSHSFSSLLFALSPLSYLPKQVLKNAYDPGVLGRQEGIVSLPDDVLELISVVETFVASSEAA